MSMESGSTRNTLGSQLSTTSSTSRSSGSSKGTPSRKKEYWQKDRKIIRILTVVAYIASVSMAAVVLSTYYVFIWSSDVPPEAHKPAVIYQRNNRLTNARKSETGSSRFNAVTQPAAYKRPKGVLDIVQLHAQTTTAINQLGNDSGEDDDEYQHQPQRPQDRIPSNEYTYGGHQTRTGYRRKVKQPTSYNKVYYSHPRRDEDEYEEERDTDLLSSAEHTDPVALPLVQQIPLPSSSFTVSVINEDKRKENETSTSTSRTTTSSVDKPYVNSEYDEDESQYVMNSNTTKPYRQRQIPTPSAPIPITKTISSFVLEPTTTEGSSTSQFSSGVSSSFLSSPVVTTTQPMISLLWNASKLVDTNKHEDTSASAAQMETQTMGQEPTTTN